MKIRYLTSKIIPVVFFICSANVVKGQFLMDMIDTTSEIGKSLLSVSKKFDRIRIGGYIQAQYQVAPEKGIPSYAGGDFNANSDNRFMLRRGRIRFEYIHLPEKGASVQFVFQFDGTERAVAIRDFWGRVYENKFKMFSLTTGMFARPFSYELNLSSSDRESPERGRMSQILMRTERDLGVMLSFEPRLKDNKWRFIKFDIGLFNGQGLAATTDFDSHKDFISRLALKPFPLSKKLDLSAGVSLLRGGLVQNTKFRYVMSDDVDTKFLVDSTPTNNGKVSKRNYYGADIQFKFKGESGSTIVRAEYMTGTQTAYANTTETPSSLPSDSRTGFYQRKFDGAYFYLLYDIFNEKNQLIFKYDWYDPNLQVANKQIGMNNINAADIKYSTLGLGFLRHFDESLKMVLYYDIVRNERTSLAGFTSDVRDNVFTARIQYRF